jgi:DNA replication protein DnaC
MSTLGEAVDKLMKSFESIPAEERARRQVEFLRSETDRMGRRVQQLFDEANCPRRHVLRQGELNREGQWGQVERKISDRLGSHFLIALIGTRGNGKTQLAVEVIRKNSMRLRTSRFCTAVDFFLAFKGGKFNEEEVFDSFLQPKLLVIDEVARRSENDTENKLLFGLLNRRYSDLRDTLLISNQGAEQFEDSMGPSLIDRMREMGGIVTCQWPSFRK